jgi:hypothetical protein
MLVPTGWLRVLGAAGRAVDGGGAGRRRGEVKIAALSPRPPRPVAPRCPLRVGAPRVGGRLAEVPPTLLVPTPSGPAGSGALPGRHRSGAGWRAGGSDSTHPPPIGAPASPSPLPPAPGAAAQSGRCGFCRTLAEPSRCHRPRPTPATAAALAGIDVLERAWGRLHENVRTMPRPARPPDRPPSVFATRRGGWHVCGAGVGGGGADGETDRLTNPGLPHPERPSRARSFEAPIGTTTTAVQVGRPLSSSALPRHCHRGLPVGVSRAMPSTDTCRPPPPNPTGAGRHRRGVGGRGGGSIGICSTQRPPPRLPARSDLPLPFGGGRFGPGARAVSDGHHRGGPHRSSHPNPAATQGNSRQADGEWS